MPISKNPSNQFQPSNPRCFPSQPESQPLTKRSNSIDDLAELPVRLRTRQTLCSKCKVTEDVPSRPQTPKTPEVKKRSPSPEPAGQPCNKKSKPSPIPSSSKSLGTATLSAKPTELEKKPAEKKAARKPIKVISGSITEVYDPSPSPACNAKVKEEKTRMFTLVPKLERLDLSKYTHLLSTPGFTVSDSENEDEKKCQKTESEKNLLKLTISKSKISGCYKTDGNSEQNQKKKAAEASKILPTPVPKSSQALTHPRPGRTFRLLNAPKRMQSPGHHPGRPSPRRDVLNHSPNPYSTKFLDDIMDKPTQPPHKKSKGKKRPSISKSEDDKVGHGHEKTGPSSDKTIPVLKIKLATPEPAPRDASPLLVDPSDEIEILEVPPTKSKEVEFVDLTEGNDENAQSCPQVVTMSPQPGPSKCPPGSPSSRAAKKALKKARKESQRKIATPQSRSPFARSPGHRWACSPLPSPNRSPFGNHTPHRNSPVYLGHAYQSPGRCSPHLYTLKSVSETTLVVKKGGGKKKEKRRRELRGSRDAENEYEEPGNGRREINQFALRDGTLFYRGTIVWARSLQGSWWPGKVLQINI